MLRGAVGGRQYAIADDVGADVTVRLLDVLLDIKDGVVEGAKLFLLLEDRPRLIGSIDAGQEPAPGAGDRFEHGGIAERLTGADGGRDVEGDQRPWGGNARSFQHETVLGFVVAEADRLGVVQRGDAPAAQGAERVSGARVGDTAVKDDVEVEPATWGMQGREIEHQVAIENGRNFDAAFAGCGQDRFLLRAQIGDEHAEPGGTGCGEQRVAVGAGSSHSDTRTSRRTWMARP